MSDSLSSGYDGFSHVPMGTRTPISFGSILQNIARKKIHDIEIVDEGNNENFLYYLFRQNLGKGWYGFAMFQAARRRGAFNVEVGFSKRKAYPTYWADVTPDYSIDGVRQRLQLLFGLPDTGWTYSSVNALEVLLSDILSEQVRSGLYKILESHQPRLESLTDRWLKRWETYNNEISDLINRKTTEILTSMKELAESYNYILEQNRHRVYETLFPPFLRTEMRKKKFLLMQACIMSEIASQDKLASIAVSLKNPEYRDDIIPALSGRAPWSGFLTLPEDEKEALLKYSYIKSLAVMEFLIGYSREVMIE